MADELRPGAEPADDSLLDQAALDALLAQAMSGDSGEALGADYLADETPLGEVDAEGMLLQTPSSPGSVAALGTSFAESAAAEGSEAIDDLDLEAMFSAPPPQYRTPPPAPEAEPPLPPLASLGDSGADSGMSQDEIDAILNAATKTPPAYLNDVSAVAPAPEVERVALEPVPPAAAVEATATEPQSVDEEPIAVLDTPAPLGPDAGLLEQAELDRLMAMAQLEPQPATSTEGDAPPEHVTLDQGELDALIEGISDDMQLAGAEMDAPLLGPGDAISLSKENVESLLGSLAEAIPAAPEVVAEPEPEPEVAPAQTIAAVPSPPAPVAAPAPAVTAAASADADVSQAMIDALIAAAGGGDSPGASEAVGSENLAAAATAADVPAPVTASGDPAQDDLDRLIEESRRKREQQKAAAAYSAVEEDLGTRKLRGMPQLESPLFRYLRENGARAVASLAAGLLVGGATFFWLYAQQQRTPDLAVLAMQRGSALEEAMEAARKMIAEGEYLRAAGLLQGKIDGAPAGRERTDAAFLRLEALYKSVADNAPLSRYDEVQTEIDGVLSQAPEHPRVADALHWKALLHKRGDLPFAALDNYELLIAQHPDAPHMDEILLEAAQLALELGVPDKAARYADRAVQDFPQSPHLAEAKLLQGDAYAHSGQRDAARKLYADSLAHAESGPLRAETVLRLGRLAFEEGNFEGAISQIRDYLSKSTVPDGNDAAYLLLAQALRKVKRDGEARDVLNDLLRFFPDSKLSPDAYVELSQTLESLGERKAAMQIANEGDTRFPTNPKVLKNLGELQGLDGNPFSAATTLMAAEDAGANDPQVLLTAARHFRTAGILDQAQAAYNKLLSEYGGTPESFTGGVELAELIYERGDSKRALERLEKIATATEGTPQQLPALLAMAKIYDEIGLPARVAEVSEKAAGLTDDPEVLARAASALIKTGSLSEGQKISERIDLSQVPPASAYNLLSELGKALLDVDPPRGIEKLEEAYSNYPDARKAENDLALVQAYLNAERAAGARRVVLDMAARAKDHAEDAPYVIDAASVWGDYLYNKADYRTAADAYALADESTAGASAQSVEGKQTDHRWPRYQRANALLKLGDYAGSLKYYDEIAQTNAPWASEAGIKAGYVRLQQKMRGEKPAELADAVPASAGAGTATARPTVPGTTPPAAAGAAPTPPRATPKTPAG